MNRIAGMTTLGEVRDQVEDMSANCYDQLVSVDDLHFLSLDKIMIGSEVHPLREVAQRSISTRWGIPFNYLKKCNDLDELTEEIQADNLNAWLGRERNEKLLFRMDGDEVRYIATERYQAMDNLEVLDRLMDLGMGEETRVKADIDPDFMSLSIPDTNGTFAVDGKDDRVQPGISITNSETGRSSLKFAAFFLRLICTNGMISSVECASRFRHISRKVIDDMPSALEGISANLDKQKDQFRFSLESHVDDPMASMASFNRQFQLDKDEREAVEWGFTFEPSDTLFHILNAYTKGAQSPTLNSEQSHNLESVGGKLLSMVRVQ